jgi:8-oxo-dGTP pyrophosphatase MutT (NUDIX family)
MKTKKIDFYFLHLMEHMVRNYVCPKAMALMSWNNKILVFEGYDTIKDQYYYRPLGGEIEFGEYAHQAIKREMMEEIGVRIYDIRYLFTLESLYVCDGVAGHEIDLVFDAKLEDPSLYGKEFDAIENDGKVFHSMWKSLEEIQSEGRSLYPEGLPEKLHDRGSGLHKYC